MLLNDKNECFFMFYYMSVICFLGYPNKDAAHVALNFTRQWLQDNLNKVRYKLYYLTSFYLYLLLFSF